MNVDKQLEVTRIMRTEIDRLAENEYARQQGEKQGLEQGLEQGRNLDVAHLHEYGMLPEEIAQALKIPLEKVLSVVKNSQTD